MINLINYLKTWIARGKIKRMSSFVNLSTLKNPALLAFISLSLLFLLDEHQVHVFQANHQIPHLQQQHGRGHRDDEGGRRRHLPRQGAEGQYGCHMAIARFLDRMCLAFRAWLTMAPLRCAAKFDPFLSLDCAPRPPPWRNPRKGRDQILPSGNLVSRCGGPPTASRSVGRACPSRTGSTRLRAPSRAPWSSSTISWTTIAGTGWFEIDHLLKVLTVIIKMTFRGSDV